MKHENIAENLQLFLVALADKYDNVGNEFVPIMSLTPKEKNKDFAKVAKAFEDEEFYELGFQPHTDEKGGTYNQFGTTARISAKGYRTARKIGE